MRVEGIKKGINIRRDGIPRGFEEEGAKSVGAGTGRGVHAPEGLMDFSAFKSSIKVPKRQRSLRIKVLKLETPGSSAVTPKEFMIESVEDSSLLIMVMNFAAIMFKHLNSIPTVTLIGTGMKITSVFIPF